MLRQLIYNGPSRPFSHYVCFRCRMRLLSISSPSLPSSAFYQAQHSTRFFASRKETEKSTVGRRVKARKAVPGLKTRKRLSGSGPKPRKIVTGSRIRHVRSTGNKKLADAAARTKRLTAKLSSLKKGDEGLPIESIGSSMTHVLGSNPDPATVQRSSIVPGDLSLGGWMPLLADYLSFANLISARCATRSYPQPFKWA